MANYYTVTNSELIVSAKEGGHSIFLIDDDAEALQKYTSTYDISDTTLVAFAGDLFANGADAIYVGTLSHLENEGYILGNAIRFVIPYNTETTNKDILAQLVEDEHDGICRYLFIGGTANMTALTATLGSSPNTYTGVDTTKLATAFSGADKNALSRVVLVPNEENIPLIVGACCANAFNDPALPMSNVILKGEAETDNTLRRKQYKNRFLKGRLTDVYFADGAYRIFGIPTLSDVANDEALYLDFTSRLIVDEIAISVIDWLKANYPRTKRNKTILTGIQLDVANILTGWQEREVIENLDTSKVTCIYDPNDRFGVIVSYVIDIVTPLYNVTIRQSVTLGTDEVTVETL